jgi:nicotinamidase-related amidase
MAGAPVRDPVGDHLPTPQNAALLVIDYQPSQFAGELQRDWARTETVDDVIEIVLTERLLEA